MSTSSDRSELERRHALMAARLKAHRENFLADFQPYPKQIEFANATADHTEVCLRAGNQVGKSTIGASMMAIMLTGLYPDWWKGRRWDRPIRAWACGESRDAVRDVNQRKLCGPPGDEANFGTGAIPKHLLTGKILSHGAGGAFDKIFVKHISGSTSELTFKSYDQERSKWQGESLDAIWCDEEPPIEHYFEALARTIATGGIIYSTFTPLKGLLGVLPRFSERSIEAVRDRLLIPMRMDDAAHLMDPKKREATLARFPAHQRRARIDGLPLLGSGAEFTKPVEELISPFRLVGDKLIHATQGEYETRGLAKLWGIDFGYNHAFGAVLCFWDRDTDIVYVVHELKLQGMSAVQHASRMRAIAADVPVAWPHDGMQHEKGTGDQLAEIYRREGLSMLPTHATLAKVGGYSFETSLAELKLRIEDGRLLISPNCLELMEEYSNYHRVDGRIVKAGDDLLSALRIAVMQLRSAKDTGLGSTRRDWRGGSSKVSYYTNEKYYGLD